MSLPTVTEKVLPKGDSSSSEHKHHRKEKPKELSTLVITESTVGIIVPDNAVFAEVLLVGGGGGGGASGRNVVNIPQYAGGGGGGGGTYVNDKLKLNGGTIDVKIGAGGLLGASAGTNGQDGGDTILSYGCHHKIAHGGAGGLGSFNGSFGGKGGEGGGKGDKGDDGFTNINSLIPGVNLQGAYGGLSGLCVATTYGNGGKGEDEVLLEPLIPTVPLIPLNISIDPDPLVLPAVMHLAETQSVSAFKRPAYIPSAPGGGEVSPSLVFGGGPFGSGTFIPHSSATVAPATSTQSRIITDEPTVSAMSLPDSFGSVSAMSRPAPILLGSVTAACTTAPSCSSTTAPVYNESNDGTPGYCKIIFYSYSDCKPSVCHESKYNKITVRDPTSIYLVNPNTSVTEVDTTNFPARLKLDRPCKKYKKVVIKLLHQNGLNAYLMPVTGGTFLLSSANPTITLIYEHCTWTIIDNLENVLSYYPTTELNSLVPYDLVSPPDFSIPQVAMSADGETLAIGQPDDDNRVGAVWIYVKRECRWARRAKLVGNDYVGLPVFQGCSVTLSSDGKTVAFGGYQDNGGVGAVWVFQCINGDWVQQGPKLVNPTGNSSSGLGYSVDISADGNTIIAGETFNPVLNEGNGILFTRTNSVWSLETNLVGTPNASFYFQGISVSISADGNTVALGSVADVVWIFVKDLVSNTWSQDGAPLTGPPGSYFGISVSLSANGLRLAVGMPFYNSTMGAVSIFNKVGGVWLQDGLPFYQPYPDPNTFQGMSVELSADGNTLAVAGNSNSVNDEGIVWVYIYQDGNWMPAQKLVNGVPTDYVLRGVDTAMSSDVSTMVTVTFPVAGVFGYALINE
jgi:hypothetical protein